MNQAIRQRLASALSSGNYPQTMILLRDHVGYCALGVLVDLFIKDHPEYKWDVKYVDYFCRVTSTQATYPMYSFCKHSAVLPDFVKKWAELTDVEEEDILVMNDNKYTFEQISSALLVS